MSFDALKLENQLCFPLYACAKEVVRLYQPVLSKIGLTYTQYLVMLVLWEQQTQSVKELGESLYLDSGTLTPLLKKMERQGLVTRRRSLEDERSVVTALTPKGEALREQAADIPARIGSCLPLSPQEAAELYRLLYQILSSGLCHRQET